MGRETFYLEAEKRKILREPAVVAASLSKWNSAQNLLPRIQEIEKIARGTKKRRSKAKGYVDGVSDLELYIAKKLMNKQGTKEILARMEQTAQAHFHTRKAVTDNYMRMTAAAPLSPEQDSARKVLSERELIEKFDRFIVKKHDQEAPTMGAILGDDRDSEADLAAQIMEDKQTLTAIVRRMIAERNNFTDEDSEEPNTKTARDEDDDARRPREVRNIDWVIKQCHEF